MVEWSSLDQATAAMERSQREPALAGVMALIDTATVHAGHFEKRKLSTRPGSAWASSSAC